MNCSVYIATSADGYIATKDGGINWLHTAGNPEVDMGSEDMGFRRFIDSVDCIIMGRRSMEVISDMNLTPKLWPYGNKRMVVLSNTLKEPPDNLSQYVEMYSGDIADLILKLEKDGFKHAYIDGGATITSFINLKLINRVIITLVPVLLGEGIPLFGKIEQQVNLEKAEAQVYKNEFIQIKYRVNYL